MNQISRETLSEAPSCTNCTLKTYLQVIKLYFELSLTTLHYWLLIEILMKHQSCYRIT